MEMDGINLWLDDEREPPAYATCGLVWVWAKTADEAIDILKTRSVEFASLDHDLADAQGEPNQGAADLKDWKEKTGYDVLLWMEENDVWPMDGVRIHTMNVARKSVMTGVVNRVYGRTFQYQYAGTHPI
jgi:hypothetical protein